MVKNGWEVNTNADSTTYIAPLPSLDSSLLHVSLQTLHAAVEDHGGGPKFKKIKETVYTPSWRVSRMEASWRHCS